MAVSDSGTTTRDLQRWIDLLNAGQEQARNGLLDRACDRLRRLARVMLGGFPAVHAQEDTDDVLNGSVLRLHAALATVHIESLKHFFHLAGQAIRRELIDLARRQGRGDGRVVVVVPGGTPDLDQPSHVECPFDLAAWSEFHQTVEDLPLDEREVVTLLWYEEMTQAEAAEVLGVCERTVLRRWHSARLKLARVIGDEKAT